MESVTIVSVPETAKRFAVRVGGWSKPRKVIVTPVGTILQVVMGSCRCRTCFGRLDAVVGHMRRNDVPFEIAESDNGDVAVILQLPEQKDICEEMSEQIGVSVSRVD